MNIQPLRNGKGVNKPFRSPFAQHTKRENDTPTQSPKVVKTKLSDNSVCKHLSYDEASPSKQQRISNNSSAEKSIAIPDKPSHEDFEILRKRVKDTEKSVNDLRRSLLYRKKNKAEDLKADIETWTAACQSALRDYQQELEERNQKSMSMSTILSHFQIPHDLVRYSEDDDAFN